MTAIVGPSGAGKSTLVNDILYPALARRLFDFVTRESEQRFLDLGFSWELGE